MTKIKIQFPRTFLPSYLLLVFGWICLSSPARAQGPSFDCTKASGEVEKLICNNSKLAVLDRKLASVYAKASKQQPGRKAPLWMVAEQRGWIKGRNECWKSEDKRSCVEQEYTNRIAEIQAKSRLVPFNGPVMFRCAGHAEIIATFHQTDPPTAILEYGDKSILAYRSRSGIGAKYEGPNVMLWEQGGKAEVTWFGEEMKCSTK